MALKGKTETKQLQTVIEGNLTLDGKVKVYNGDLIVKGSVFGTNGGNYQLMVKGNLTVYGDITASPIIISGDINAAGSINSLNSNPNDIIAHNIKARVNIKARGGIKANDIDTAGSIYAGGAVIAHNIKAGGDVNTFGITINNITTSGNLNTYGDIIAHNVAARNIEANCSDIFAHRIITNDIKAVRIIAHRSIAAHDIKTQYDITAFRYIKARDIDAGSGNITAVHINANNIKTLYDVTAIGGISALNITARYIDAEFANIEATKCAKLMVRQQRKSSVAKMLRYTSSDNL